jgi:hypothetical protein
MFSRSVNDISRVNRIMIVGDATTWSVTSDNSRGVIYGHEIFIILATDIMVDPYLDDCSKLRLQGAQNVGKPYNLFCCAATAVF